MNLLKWQTGVVIALSSILAMLFAIGAAAEEFSRYDIVVTLDPQTHTLAGTQIVDYVNDGEEALEAITFVLVANQGRDPNPYLHPALEDAQYIDGFDPTWTKILSVTNGAGDPMDYQLEAIPPALTTYSLDDGLLRVRLAEPLDPGGRTQVARSSSRRNSPELSGETTTSTATCTSGASVGTQWPVPMGTRSRRNSSCWRRSTISSSVFRVTSSSLPARSDKRSLQRTTNGKPYR
ncbi:hypothetical protein KAX17_04775 [Candidatus Bipolaricaulota bacterium]|nr:hypothetical protein [Candidatus Bipolaricaulota bacterium]